MNTNIHLLAIDKPVLKLIQSATCDHTHEADHPINCEGFKIPAIGRNDSELLKLESILQCVECPMIGDLVYNATPQVSMSSLRCLSLVSFVVCESFFMLDLI